ncbi:MAG: type IV pilin N-terminal domain-containing protein [Methanomethylovorans sp.]|jgi:hypothetical protein|nr:type IV pilin N-terminal domain-containing protein [Methanomethylovorans sp.]
MASEMVGEILKLAISVTLVAVFSIGVYAYLPEERVPYLEIEMSWNANQQGSVDIVHAGGDILHTQEITILVMDAEKPFLPPENIKLSDIITDTNVWRFPRTVTIDLSDYFTDVPDIVTVRVIHPRAILAEGTVYSS